MKSRISRNLAICCVALGLPALCGVARAQLRLPVPALPLNLPGAAHDLQGTVQQQVRTLRQLEVSDLLGKHRRELEADPAGEAMVRGEIVAWAPSAAAIAAADAQGFAVLRDIAVGDLGRLLVLAVPRHWSTARSLRSLRATDSVNVYDFNHIYMSGGTIAGAATASIARAEDTPASGTVGGGPKLGLIDAGVDITHKTFHGALIHQWGCDGKFAASAHGTAVASLLSGALPGAQLFAADVYCGAATGGAVEGIAAALGWMAQNQIGVVNMSLVGPQNSALEHVIRAMLTRGHIIVAAVGNDGPASPPLYPAAYPGVIGVTGVDAGRKVLLEANRGPQVIFAAPGAQLKAAAPANAYVLVRGTSFAAPIVAALLAADLPAPDPVRAARAIQALVARAIDLGPPGKDAIYGNGLVGGDFRLSED
jgi:subtilisin family serine protease